MPNLTSDDAALLVAAHLDLLAAQVEGVTVLGRCDRPDLIDTAHAMQATAAAPTVLPLLAHDHQEVAA